MVRGQNRVVIRLRGTADQVDHREDPLQDLRERIRIVEPADGDLRPCRPQRFGRLGPAHARPHLVAADEHRYEGSADQSGGASDHDRHRRDATDRRRG